MKRMFVISGLIASLMSLFGFGKSTPKGYKPTGAYLDLRQQVLSFDPVKIGLASSSSNPMRGVLMETGYPEAVATLVTLGDGTVSLYFSSGGGIIGVGQHEGPRKAGEAFIAFAPRFISYAKPTRVFPLPTEGHTRFYFLCFDGVLTVEAKEDDLGNNRLPLSPLFHKAHEVITAARLVNEGLRGRGRA
jgi:hypothetical protein